MVEVWGIEPQSKNRPCFDLYMLSRIDNVALLRSIPKSFAKPRPKSRFLAGQTKKQSYLFF